jgi:hypothetical protein
MLVEFETLGLVDEVGIGLTKPGDAKHVSQLSTFGLHNEEVEVEYSSKHKDSMNIQMVELIHASTKKVRDVKRSYGRIIQHLSLKLEHLHGVIICERKWVE